MTTEGAPTMCRSSKTIAIIGGGMAGLSAGIYGQWAGFETTIYEKNDTVGGSISGWKRDGFTIDNCLHWLTGTMDDTASNLRWKELGILSEDTKIIERPYLYASETDGVRLTLWRDPERTRQEMLAVSPEDEAEINLFIDCVQTAVEVSANKEGLKEMAKKMLDVEAIPANLDFARRTAKYIGLNTEQWADRFQSPAIRNLLLDFSAKEYESYWLILVYSFFAVGNADIIEGGSLKIAESLVKTYLEAGGTIRTGMAADQVIIEDEKPRIDKGVKLVARHGSKVIFENEEEVSADYIICACDIKYAYAKLIRMEEHKSDIVQYIMNHQKDFPMYSAFQIAYGVDGLFEEIDDSLGFACEPIEIGMHSYDRMLVKNYRCYGDYIAPEGKTVIQCLFIQYERDFNYWKRMYETDVERYRLAKKNVADAITHRILTKYPQYADRLHVLDTWTPYSYARRNNDTNGAYMRFITTPISKQAKISGEIPGVDNVFLASHWLKYPGGLPMAAMAGKEAVDLIAKREQAD